MPFAATVAIEAGEDLVQSMLERTHPGARLRTADRRGIGSGRRCDPAGLGGDAAG
jgi:hypothetical protein